MLAEKAKFARWLDSDDPVVVANALINLWQRTGPKAGQPFWGCSAYPACRGTREFGPKQ